MAGDARETLRSRMSAWKRPFLGHAGGGARIAFVEAPWGLTLREATGSQVGAILGLAALGPGVMAVLLVNRDEISKSHWVGQLVVGLFCAVGWIEGARRLFRFVRGRHVEIRAAEGAVLLCSARHKVLQRLEGVDGGAFDVQVTRFNDGGGPYESHTLRVKPNGVGPVDLCTTDDGAVIEALKAALERCFRAATSTAAAAPRA